MIVQRKIKAVILDFVKTIVSFEADWDQLRKINAEIFKKHGLNIDYQILRPIFEQTSSQLSYLKNLNYAEREILQIEKELLKAQKQFEEDSIETASIYEDTGLFLKYAYEQKIKTAILTSNISSTVVKVLSKFNIAFKGPIIGRDNVKNPKPNTEGVEKVLDLLEVEGKECIFIGDADFDIDAGNQAGCFTVFLKRNETAKLTYTKADLEIQTLIEIVFPKGN